MSITYTKLKSGAWGIRSTEEINAGQMITVAKKSGESKQEIVEKVVWSGNGVWLAALRSTAAERGGQRPLQGRSPGTRGYFRGRRTGCSCGSIEGQPRDSDCAQCQYDNE